MTFLAIIILLMLCKLFLHHTNNEIILVIVPIAEPTAVITSFALFKLYRSSASRFVVDSSEMQSFASSKKEVVKTISLLTSNY